MTVLDAWAVEDPTLCEKCGREGCEDHLPAEATQTHETQIEPFPDSELEDATVVAGEGKALAAAGVPYVVKDIIPAIGAVGFLVAFAKVGKTTFGQALAAHVAMGLPFLERETTATRVLYLTPEDPPEYTAYLARYLDVERGRLVFRRKPLILNTQGLQQLCATIQRHSFGLVLIASWQAVVRGLVKDENDNAGAVRVVESVKAASRASRIPWLIDAHSGKGEDQSDAADPSRAMRGASAAVGAADFTLSLRYNNGAFGSQRQLSGKGRFVSLKPFAIDYDDQTGQYSVIGAQRDTTWRLICEAGALDETPRSLLDISRACGFTPEGDKLSGNHRRQLQTALSGRPDVGTVQEIRRNRKVTLYRRLADG
jgi:hypothetical protein